MCDTIEVTTLPVHKSISYKISGNGLVFYVKSGGRGGAVVGLSKWPNSLCNYWVYIAHNSYTNIKSAHESEFNLHGEYTPELLSDRHYTKFWLTWNSDVISLGKDSNTKPIISRNNCNVKKISYVTLSSCENRVYWKLLLPPVLPVPHKRLLNVGKPQWVTANDQLPDGSLIGGYENEILYIIRSPHRGSLTPGKFVPSLGVGFISWGGEALEKNDLEVLCGVDCEWMATNNDRIPVKAVEAGFSEGYDTELLYVGRAKHLGHIIPGKVQPSHKVCYIPYDGREIAKMEYEILVCQSVNEHAANKIFLTLDHGAVLVFESDDSISEDD
ncbi:unnamed protein product [Pieris macdunnoughi]|uniref:Farnesoic acid O-methyl transferase domain-containing protein n=1 Tax=Pieris macdunnoughi TaxID=345717 RepID=A0A821NK98_9NEOP|nr:unnamed protein product [Pieris macdunnoughi]